VNHERPLIAIADASDRDPHDEFHDLTRSAARTEDPSDLLALADTIWTRIERQSELDGDARILEAIADQAFDEHPSAGGRA
jgi:hypothetical protein